MLKKFLKQFNKIKSKTPQEELSKKSELFRGLKPEEQNKIMDEAFADMDKNKKHIKDLSKTNKDTNNI